LRSVELDLKMRSFVTKRIARSTLFKQNSSLLTGLPAHHLSTKNSPSKKPDKPQQGKTPTEGKKQGVLDMVVEDKSDEYFRGKMENLRDYEHSSFRAQREEVSEIVRKRITVPDGMYMVQIALGVPLVLGALSVNYFHLFPGVFNDAFISGIARECVRFIPFHVGLQTGFLWGYGVNQYECSTKSVEAPTSRKLFLLGMGITLLSFGVSYWFLQQESFEPKEAAKYLMFQIQMYLGIGALSMMSVRDGLGPYWFRGYILKVAFLSALCLSAMAYGFERYPDYLLAGKAKLPDTGELN